MERKGLPVRVMHVLFGCEPWFVTLTEENKLRAFENQVLRKVSVAKRDEGTGEWRKIHNENLVICTAHRILFG